MPDGNTILTWYIAGAIAVAVVAGIWSGFFRARKIQPGGFRLRTFRNEMFFAFITLTLSASLLVWTREFFDAQGWITFREGSAPWYIIGLEYALYFFLFDTWFYWGHRLMHMEPFYTWVHKVHHWSTAPNPLTTFSETPFEAIINGIFLTLFLAIFPVHDTSVALMAITAPIMGLYVHSGFEFLPRWWNRSWLSKWFITATFHDQHHKYFRYNFGGFTPIWDYLCGTNRKKYEADFDALKARARQSRRVQAAVEAAD